MDLTSTVFSITLNPPLGNRNDPIDTANREMQDYQTYVNELCDRLPGSFDRLNRFLNRGNCPCFDTKKTSNSTTSGNLMARLGHRRQNDSSCRTFDLNQPCDCVERGGNCVCWATSDVPTCPNGCKTSSMEDSVRVYAIDPEKSNWEEFLDVKEYHASKPDEFRCLQERLYSDPVFGTEEDEDESTIPTTVPSGDPLPRNSCRLITVNHLSPKVAKLLGAKFKISADFFNRHLPGTEAISGRLVSRLPSSVQIDFDELYESAVEFKNIAPNVKEKDLAEKGHSIIKENIEKHFLFLVGWDYFPITERDWASSIGNIKMKSGYEVLLREEGMSPKNVFQFNLNHRISVFSEPVGHPRTAIIIFYPVLPVHTTGFKASAERSGQCIHDLRLSQQPCPCGLHGNTDSVRFRSIPNAVPTPAQWKEIRADPHVSEWEVKRRKQSYASAYDMVLKLHLKERLKKRQTWTQRQNQNQPDHMIADPMQTDIGGTNNDMFIHIFGAPLFRLVSANWARLIVRRSFDLDLLEWRSSNCLHSETVEEIKSRRVAITRHQRDITTSLDILRSLAAAEKGIPLQLHEVGPGFDLVRPNGFMATKDMSDSWWNIFWDFYELKVSMETLQKRATKIHDGIVGQIGVVGSENSGNSNRHSRTLNIIAFVFTSILLPFSIVPPIFNTLDGHGGPEKSVHNFKVAMGSTAGLTIFIFIALAFLLELYGAGELSRPWWVKKISVSRLLKWCEQDEAKTLIEENENREKRARQNGMQETA
ncbi:hypothetical protein GP486_004298 [Trichoglossum hirsutum]|uniref:Uncharacterized protein n=1 Tax=Trichoglossum hirsutum TaxID=265104 RepID=A0A9P8LBB5_9PEZI|nr:hypothetical protein GP486_004298 [Trichoglossum hirsutum]